MEHRLINTIEYVKKVRRARLIKLRRERKKLKTKALKLSRAVVPVVYFIRCNEFIKIGIAVDVSRRIGILQIGCPYKLTLAAKISHTEPEELEQHLHRKFSDRCVSGEWFRITDQEIADAIACYSGTGDVGRIAGRNSATGFKLIQPASQPLTQPASSTQ